MIPIYKPYLPQSSLNYAHDALDSTWISSRGKYIQIAQEKLEKLLNIRTLLVNNGTSACHLMAKTLNKKVGNHPHKILCPDNVYVAAWNAFLFDKDLFELITIKTDINTWNIDFQDLDKKIKIHPDASILIVHNMGNIINVPELQRKYPNNIFVEDACESFMGTYENKYAGTTSFVSAFSTFGNKTITSGEGGFITTNDEDAYLYAQCIHGQGQSNKKFIHNELGYNFRSTNIQAALLCGQLEILSEIIGKKYDIFEKYRTALKDREDILLQECATNTQHANWMMGIRIPKQLNYETAEIYFRNNGIEIRPMFYPITHHAHLANNKDIIIDDCAIAKQLNKECIILPSFPDLTQNEQIFILKTLDEYIKSL